MYKIFATQLVILLVIASSWIVNIVKFCKSDFDLPAKREIIHGVGLIPGVSLVTCWFNIDESEQSE